MIANYILFLVIFLSLLITDIVESLNFKSFKLFKKNLYCTFDKNINRIIFELKNSNDNCIDKNNYIGSSDELIKELLCYKKDFPHIIDEQWDLLSLLCLKVKDWNEKVNLISRKDVQYLIPNHIIPSLSISLVHQFSTGKSIIDVGTGGGLPGVPLAILFPSCKFTLLDSNNKKMMIVKDIVNSLKLKNVNIVVSRAEEYNKKFDYIIGRAVSNLPNFLSFSSHFLNRRDNNNNDNNKYGLYYLKGGDFTQEIVDAEVKEYNLNPINQLIPNLETDKFVLFIPQHEIDSFYNRMQLSNNNNSSNKLKNLK